VSSSPRCSPTPSRRPTRRRPTPRWTWPPGPPRARSSCPRAPWCSTSSPPGPNCGRPRRASSGSPACSRARPSGSTTTRPRWPVCCAEAKLIVGHNLMGFDLIAFALHHGVDIHELAEQGRLIDTMLTEVVVNPPEARTKQGQIMRSLGLDALGAAKELGAKSHDLAALAKEFGGYDQIPDRRRALRRVLRRDVNLTAKIGPAPRAPRPTTPSASTGRRDRRPDPAQRLPCRPRPARRAGGRGRGPAHAPAAASCRTATACP
jgi:hypothetical protein